MNAIQLLAAQPWVERLGSTLLHFLWQGVPIAAVYAAARKWLRHPPAERALPPRLRRARCMAAAPRPHVGPAAPAGPPCRRGILPRTAFCRRLPAARLRRSLPAPCIAVPPPFLPWVVAVWLCRCRRLLGTPARRLDLRRAAFDPAGSPRAARMAADPRRPKGPHSRLPPGPPPGVRRWSQAPAVVGWLRPVVLVPIGALAGLPPEQVEALLLHELAHIRRHDYLVNIAAERRRSPAVLPSRRLVGIRPHPRRTRTVLRRCGRLREPATPSTHAPWRSSPPRLPPLSVGDGRERRLPGAPHRPIVGPSRAPPRAPSPAGSGGGRDPRGILACLAFGQPAAALNSKSPPSSAADHGPRMMRPLPNGLTANVPFNSSAECVRSAAVSDRRRSGVDQFGAIPIDAKAAGNASHDQISLMLQSLLEERFQLKIHRETRELPVFNLVIAKGGPKMPPPREGGCTNSDDPPPELTGGRMAPPGSGPTPPTRCGGLDVMLQMGGARMSGGKVPMPEFVRMLSMVLDRTVVDRTGLTGPFDVRLDFLPDDSTPHLPPPPPGASSDGASPPILSALPEQLGLRLEASKGPVEVIVIDRVERPSAN